MHQLVDFPERRVQNHRAGRLRGHIAIWAERDACRGRDHGRSVIDSITDKQGFGMRGLLPHDGDLLLRALISVNCSDSEPSGDVAHLRFTVSREQYQPTGPMPWSQVADEPSAFLTGLVAEAESGCHRAIDH